MYRKEILSYITSTFFVLLAMSLHLLEFFGVITFSVNAIVFFLYTAMILLWDRIMESRILRTQSKKYFKMVASLMIGYLAIRTLKYEILFDNMLAIKYIRYIYYFFSLNMIHLVFFISLMIAKSEHEPISNRWNLLWSRRYVRLGRCAIYGQLFFLYFLCFCGFYILSLTLLTKISLCISRRRLQVLNLTYL